MTCDVTQRDAISVTYSVREHQGANVGGLALKILEGQTIQKLPERTQFFYECIPE